MASYRSICLLLASVFMGHAANSGQALVTQRLERGIISATKSSEYQNSPPLAAEKPLITITGLCDHFGSKTGSSECKTVITQAEFDFLINAVGPDMSKRARREFALQYSDALVMAKKAEQLGLDKSANYEERMKLARIEVLSQALKKEMLAKASDISEKDIEDYYRNNIARFEKAEIERVYVPNDQSSSSAVNRKITDADNRELSAEVEHTMKKRTDDLHTRAIAGEDFTTLQAEAFQAVGIKNAPPATTLWIRRISLPASQASVMDLKPGEISTVLSDSNGYYIYKLRSKDMLSLDQARDEIKEALRSQRVQSQMRSILESTTPILDESYFAR